MPKPRCWRGEQTRERASRGARSAARVGAIAIQRVVHRKASASPACAQSRASAGGAAFWHSAASRGEFCAPAPLLARRANMRERTSCGTRSAARVGAIAIPRMVHRKASASSACAQSRASAGGAAFWHSGCKPRGDFGPNSAAGEASKRERAPAAARGVQRALVRLRFSVLPPVQTKEHSRLGGRGAL